MNIIKVKHIEDPSNQKVLIKEELYSNLNKEESWINVWMQR